MPVTDERTQRLLAARLAREQSAQRLPSLVAGLARQGALVWSGGRGRIDGEPLRPLTGPDGRIVALDLASHVYTRVPYDDTAPVPGGVDPAGWRAG